MLGRRACMAIAPARSLSRTLATVTDAGASGNSKSAGTQTGSAFTEEVYPLAKRISPLARTPRPDVSVDAHLPVLEHSAEHALARKQFTDRPGLLAVKVGMTALWGNTGRRRPATVLQLDRCQVIQVKTAADHGYNAVQVGMGSRKPANVSRALLGHYAASGVHPKTHLAEVRVKPDVLASLTVGQELKADVFTVGDYLDVIAPSKGKGFAGVMKRHGFKGLRASHGVSISHRSAGSMGQSQDPGRVLPGKKMAGRLGGRNHTQQNVPVLEVDRENGLIIVGGPVPGQKGSVVKLQAAIKKPEPATGRALFQSA
ncbi:hypothetical protein PYCC9005_000159 [Savitreella phatthalungensis]